MLTYKNLFEIIRAMITQEQIATLLERSQPTISLMLSGKLKVSWPMAARLAEIFPGKTIQQWKQATPEDLKKVFAQLKDMAA